MGATAVKHFMTEWLNGRPGEKTGLWLQQSRIHLSLFLIVMLTGNASGVLAQPELIDPEVSQTYSVLGDYSNPAYVSPPQVAAIEPQATTLFGGSVCNNGCPNDGAIYLARSAFGQPVAGAVPYPEFIQESVDDARKRLYYSEADNIPADQDDPDNGSYSNLSAALRYKDLIYGVDPGGSGDITNLLVARDPAGDPVAAWTALYGNAERARLVDVERILRNAVKYAPGNQKLRQTLLDLYYDRAVAEIITAKELFAAAAKKRFVDYVSGQRVVDTEITVYSDVIDGYRFALAGYFELLRDPMGVDVSRLDSSVTTKMPFGYYLFQQEVPARALHGATYLDATGAIRDVITDIEVVPGAVPSELFTGYKDLVLLFDLMADLAEAVKEQTRLYAIRGIQDIQQQQEILALLKQAHEQLYLEGHILQGIFSPGSLPDFGSPSGLQEAIQRWSHGLTELAAARGWIEGTSNVLGFNKDFLMLVQNSGQDFDSFDAIRGHLQGPLDLARNQHLLANASYDNYRGTRDQLATQYLDRRTSLDNRLFELVGAHRCDASGSDCNGQCPDVNGACYFSPGLNQGSAVQLQLQSFELANIRLESSLTRQENLYRRIEIEIDRRGKEALIEDAINKVVLEYGDKQANLTEAIARARARAARARKRQQQNAGFFAYAVSIIAAPATGGLSLVAGAAGAFSAITASTDGDSSAEEARITAEKERLAASERVEISDLNSQILDISSAALIKTWWLEASVIALDIEETELLASQATAQLNGILNEIIDLERQMDQQNNFLADRYFADPIHRLRMQTDMINAGLAFNEAQKWVFFAARALEYKWNFPFDHFYGQDLWDANSVFGVRNVTELDQLVLAMDDYNAQSQFSITKDDYFDWFSVREDFFGYKYIVSGQIQLYPDPVTGQFVDAYTAFRSELQSRMDQSGNIFIDFSTVRELPGGSFFRGVRVDSSGNVISKGLMLDKIEWLKIALPGRHSLGNSQILGNLTYGGTSFIRDWDAGVAIPTSPDHVVGEMTAYPTRYWFFHVPSGSWRFTEGLSAPVQMQLAQDPRIPPGVNEINVFKERSVAATGWKLNIPTLDLGQQILNLDELDDIELYFYHRAAPRP